MGISNIPSNLRPGICTSSTRPTTPYEGQVIYETDTNRVLVWDNAAWVAPNSTTTNPPALEFIKSQTVGTTVSSVTVTNAFSSDYDNYKIIISGIDTTNSFGNQFQMRLANAANHYGSIYADLYNGGVSQFYRTNAQNQFWMGFCSPDNDLNVTFDIINPQKAFRTTWNGFYHGSAVMGWLSGYYSLTTQFTDVTFLVDVGTMTGGTIRVYGYRN